MRSTPGITLAKKPGMSRVKLAMRVRPTGPLVSIIGTLKKEVKHDVNQETKVSRCR